MSRLVALGEIMMRLNPKGYLRIKQAEQFEATYAGGEANVCGMRSPIYGMDASYVTKLPRSGDRTVRCANELRRYGVDTSNMMLRGGAASGHILCREGRFPARFQGASMTAPAPPSRWPRREDFDWDRDF